MVLMALDAAGVHSRDRSALAWLHTQQDGDGGFPYQAGAGTDPDSTALVLQALIATGQNPEAPAWAPGGHTPLAELIATQDGNGGFTFPGNTAPDPFTTAQVPPALELQAVSGTRCLHSRLHAGDRGERRRRPRCSTCRGSSRGVTGRSRWGRAPMR